MEGNTKRFQEELQAAVPKAKANVAELQSGIENPRLYDQETDVGEALSILESMKKKIDEVALEVDRCKRFACTSFCSASYHLQQGRPTTTLAARS